MRGEPVERWEPPEWIPPGTDLSFLPAWDCGSCGQRNSGWARECGRCEADRVMDAVGLLVAPLYRVVLRDGYGIAALPWSMVLTFVADLHRTAPGSVARVERVNP